MIDRLAQLVATQSLSRHEAVAADLVARELGDAGMEVHRQGNNVWCEFGDAPRPRLLLNSHLDTVPPGDGWSGDPWTPRQVDGRLIGLGANDAKGCVVALIEAALRRHREQQRGKRLDGTVVLALTAEEEISGQGLSSIVDNLRPLDAAIVGEPTGMAPMIVQRGLLILRGTAHGKTAHPANTPMDGATNAIQIAAEDLHHLRTFDWGLPHPLLGRAQGHVTMIEGGVARNVIPDRCTFYLDIRTTPLELHAALTARLRSHLRATLDVHSDRLVSVETPFDATIVRAIQAALPDRPPAGSPTMSDMVFLTGVDAVKIGPGESARSHTPDEFILESELAHGAAAYYEIIGAYFDLTRRRGAAPTQQRQAAGDREGESGDGEARGGNMRH